MQYVGGELNATVKEWDQAGTPMVRWALMYPDAYEVGLPNQGVQILYEVLNEQPDVLGERTYAVWPDLEKLMREHGIPQFTVDGHRPVGAFDVLGVSFSTELGYTNLLTALDLAGIPLAAVDRGARPGRVRADQRAAAGRADPGRAAADRRRSGAGSRCPGAAGPDRQPSAGSGIRRRCAAGGPEGGRPFDVTVLFH